MDVKKIAKLAHLAITDEEAELYGPQMKQIVEYVEQLNELDTTDVEPMLGGLTDEGMATETFRDDLPGGSFTQDEAISRAPSATEGHFRVPKVL